MSRRGIERESIIDRYSPADMASNTRDCHYDNLREHGFPSDQARRIAKDAADHTQRALDMKGGTGAAPSGATSGHGRNRFRVPFPWEEAEDSGSE